MKTFAALLTALTITTAAAESSNKIIDAVTAQKTDRSIKISGKVNHLPPGTALEAEVLSINGKRIGDDIIIKTPESFTVNKNGEFEAHLNKYGSLGGYNFPSGKYNIQIYASFNRAWQTVEVAKSLGVKLDDQGRSDLGEPRALPNSPDLVKGALGVRMLKAQRTVLVSDTNTKFEQYKSKRARLEIIGNGTVEKPAALISGNEQLAISAAKALNNRKAGQAISLICYGSFPGFGYIASDLYYSSGKPNVAFDLNNGTTLIELCYQYEDSLLHRR